MKKYFQFFWYLMRHKLYVGIECIKMGLFWAAKAHDWDKLLPYKFYIYSNFLFGDKENMNLELETIAHRESTKHHWQYWVKKIDREIYIKEKDGSRTPHRGLTVVMEMPDRYIKEMVCDWIGANRAQRKTYNVKEWWNKENQYIILGKETRKKVEELLSKIYG